MQPPFAACLLLAAGPLLFTTWDEPWHEQVVAAADSLVKAEILTNKNGRKVTARRLEHVAGAPVPDEFVIDRYSLLETPTRSNVDGHDELEFVLRKGGVYYLLLDDPKAGNSFAMATPSAGWAFVTEGKVVATFRHSLHLATVPEAAYVVAQKAIFQFLHGEKYDGKAIRTMLHEWLRKAPPENDDAAGVRLFNHQHMALECFYYFGDVEDAPLLEPFLRASWEHMQASAVRALSRLDTKATRDRLFQFLAGDGENFAKVMAVRALERLDARDCADRLAAFAKGASTDDVGMGCRLMDPRIATQFPGSVKAACEGLLAKWRKGGAPKK